MDLFLSSLNVVMPLFFMMLVGWIIRKLGLVTENGLAELNRLNVKIFLPIMLFANVCEGDLLHGADPKFLLFALVASVVLFAVFMILIPLFVKDRARCSALVLGVYRPNTAIYGMPLALGIFNDSEKVSNVLMMVSVVILITNFLAVMVTEIFKGEKLRLPELMLRSVKNPIIYGLLLGMFFQFLPFDIPSMILSPIKSLAAVATPVAFIVLGATFTLRSCKVNAKAITFATLIKLVVTPLIAIPLGVWVFGFRGASLVALLCAFATPTAVSTQPLVREAGGDSELLGEIIVFSTALSILTIFGFVYFFKLVGFF